LRKANAIISIGLIGLLLLHGISGAFQLIGLIPGGSSVRKALAWILLALLAVHIVIGVVLTVKTLRASAKAGAAYRRENTLFWVRRLSGFALTLLLLLHLLIFAETGTGVFRLHDFGPQELLGQLLLLAALAIHLLCNVKPLAIALGLHSGKGYGRDILLILAVVMVFCALALVIYDLRWNVLWRAGV
jgi:succinate dehydrogenase/fumarate reductase cytochrome b subunit